MRLFINILNWEFEDIHNKNVCKIFGRTSKNKKIYVEILNFKPYFYTEYNDSIIEYCNIENIKYYIEDRYKFYGFTGNKLFKFIKLQFINNKTYYYHLNILKKRIDVYDSVLSPILRLIHIKNINPSGWIYIDKYINIIPETLSDINISCDWVDIHRHEDTKIQLFTVASFDIECMNKDCLFPMPERIDDKVIKIGITVSEFNSMNCFHKRMLSLGKINKFSDDVEIECFDTEEELLLGFTKAINEIDPDIITGYNIFNFDFTFLHKRSELLGIEEEFSKFSRIVDKKNKFIEKKLSSSSLGDNIMRYYNLPGRIIIDLIKYVQNTQKLESYSLDNVSSYFFKESLEFITSKKFKTNTEYLYNYQYIYIISNDGVVDSKIGKFQVINISNNIVEISKNININKSSKYFWTQAKDDMDHNLMYYMQTSSIENRTKLSKYCLQDCLLCNKLISKLQVVQNNMAMSNVCYVPFSFLFLRGQGIKIFSLVSKKCMELNYSIIDFRKSKENIRYDGAIVLEPKKGIYYDPVCILDFASLYPNSMILKNLSHEMFVNDKKYLYLKDYEYHTITYDDSVNNITIKSIFAQKKDNTRGIIPNILLDILDARKKCRGQIKREKNDFIKSILNGLQLAYKITANSIYGQTGSYTSPLYLKEIAASTTAIGRNMILYSCYYLNNIFNNLVKFSKKNSQEKFMNKIYEIYSTYPTTFSINDCLITICSQEKKIEKIDEQLFIDFYNYINKLDKLIIGDVIYGDTDSIFFTLNTYDVKYTIELGIFISKMINYILPNPMLLEYEKVYKPFILISKKKYVGNLYEYDENIFYQHSMGIVLKRRDNAQIVKIICNEILNELLNKENKNDILDITEKLLNNVINNKYDLDKFIITKILRETYTGNLTKDDNYHKKGERGKWYWENVECPLAHVNLCQKIAKRDPGNKPCPNDRISYIFLEKKGNNIHSLQKDHIEEVNYYIKNKDNLNLKLDYDYYINNQIKNPLVQFLELTVNKKDINDLFNKINSKIFRQKNKISDIRSFF